MSLSDSQIVLLSSSDGRFKALISSEEANRRRAEGVGTFDGKYKVHATEITGADPDGKLVKYWGEHLIPNKEGVCRRCSDGSARCRNVSVRVFRYDQTTHGPATWRHVRVKGSRRGAKDSHSALIRRADPTLEQIRADRREMTARPESVPFDHKYLGRVESRDVPLVCEEHDLFRAFLNNLNLEFESVRKRVASFCTHSHPPCETCERKGVEVARLFRESWNERYRRAAEELEQNSHSRQYKVVPRPTGHLVTPVVYEKSSAEIAMGKVIGKMKAEFQKELDRIEKLSPSDLLRELKNI